MDRLIMNENLIKDLLHDAKMAAKKAYVPYSRFAVGAVIVLNDGARVLGANIENASYPVSICAERTAMIDVVMKGRQHEIAMVVLYTRTARPGSPCGMCRQFLSEFISSNTPIICGNDHGLYEVTSIGDLLPKAFTKNDLTSIIE